MGGQLADPPPRAGGNHDLRRAPPQRTGPGPRHVVGVARPTSAPTTARRRTPGRRGPGVPARQPLAGRSASRDRLPTPGHDEPLPVCCLADGQSARSFARTLEPAILAGHAPAVLLVGVHNAFDPAAPWPDRRAQEYLPGQHRRRFDAHLRFVIGEVVPWTADHAGAAPPPWLSAGFSNSAVWAIGAAQRRPDVSSQARETRVRHHLAAGTLEPGFRRATTEWAQRLQRAGLPCHDHEWVGGHDHQWWQQQLPPALNWLLKERG